MEPAVVQVRGPRSAMSSLREVPTRPIDISGLDEDVAVDAALDLPRSVEPADSQIVQARITVVSETEQRRIEDVPVYVRGAEGTLIAHPPRIAGDGRGRVGARARAPGLADGGVRVPAGAGGQGPVRGRVPRSRRAAD